MVKRYEPAVFQPTIRPSWAGALEYIPNDELAQILKAITVYPLIDLPDSVFWNKTIKPDLEQQHKKFLSMCEDRGRGARSYWGEHKLSTSLPQDNLCKDKDKDKVKDKVKGYSVNSDVRNTRARDSSINNTDDPQINPPTLEEVVAEASLQNSMIGMGGYKMSEENAKAFFAQYDTAGWVKGPYHTPIRNWKSALRGWSMLKERDRLDKLEKDGIPTGPRPFRDDSGSHE